MTVLYPFKINPESIFTDLGTAELKSLLNVKEKSFYLKWISDDKFIISLNLSIGTNTELDLNNDAKSAVIV